MSTLGGSVPDIANVTQVIDPKGDPAYIARVLKQNNAIIDDIPFEPGNLIDGHRSTVEVSLPAVSARVANQGIAATFGSDDNIDDACAIFESKSEMDRVVAETGGMEFVDFNRRNQAEKHISSHGRNFARVLIYGSPSVPTEFVGLANRLNSLSGNTSQNVFNCGGSGSDLTSIYGVMWGTNRAKGIYPRGTVGGLQRHDEGLVSILDATPGAGAASFLGYRETFTWRCGLAVPDWRFITRACNIDVSDLNGNGAAATNLIDVMIAMREAIPDNDGGVFVYYMNRTVRRQLRIQLRDKVAGGGGLTYENYAGRGKVMMFEDSPVRIVDQIVETETAVT
jgi:hypothetical protein